MKSQLTIVLDVATEALERQKKEEDPTSGVTGHLLFLLDGLTDTLSQRQRQRVKYILALYQHCSCPSVYPDPAIE